jgi:hypothetical protein
MSDPPSGDEEMRVVPRDKTTPPVLHTAAQENETPKAEPTVETPTAAACKGRFTFVASVILVAITFSIGFSYLLQMRWPFPSPATHSSPATAFTAEPSISAAPTPPLIPLNADMLHVTAIALGQSNLAVVNGKRVTEGDSLVVVTSDGPAAVRVAKIEQGVVHFDYGTEKIEAKLLTETVAQKAPP